MESAAPDPAARLLTVVEAVAARTEEALRRLDELDGAPVAAERPSLADPANPVRLAAIELAVSGSSRAETAARLRDRFLDADLDTVLDDVFGTGGTVP
jgi:hypothetical protein